MNIYILCSVFCVLNVYSLLSQESAQPESNFYSIQSSFIKKFTKQKYKYYEQAFKNRKLSEDEKESPDAELFLQFKRWEYFWKDRVDPLKGTFPNPLHLVEQNDIKNKSEQVINYKYPETVLANTWKYVGSPLVPNGGGAGRTNCITPIGSNNSQLWTGAACGGVWKTVNAGALWQTTTDKLPSLGISDIAYDYKSNAIYAATGDADGQNCYSAGIFKSTDAGATWNITGLTFKTSSTRLISRILIHPSSSDILYAASNNGIYKSTDAGKTWVVKQAGNFRDIEFKPATPLTMYGVTQNSFYISTDGGEKWTINSNTTFPSNTSRISIAVTNSSVNNVYALISSGNSFGGFYQSTNSGQTWVAKTSSLKPNILGYNYDGQDNGGQGTYDLALAVSPTNPNIVFVGGINIWKSTDAGKTWKISAHWYGDRNSPYVHADIHDLDFEPALGATLYAATDGGIFKTTNNGTTWTDLSSNLNIMQFYHVSNSQTDPTMIIGGAQDNGTNLGLNKDWQQVLGGDGMNCLINPDDPNYVYGSIYYGSIYISTNGATSFVDAINRNVTNENGNWVTPFVFNPLNPSIMYAGYANLWVSNNYGKPNTWKKLSNFANNSGSLNFIAISPADTSIIVIGNSSTCRLSKDSGKSWITLTFPNGITSGSIRDFVFHPTNPNYAIITLSGITPNRQVFITKDLGANWENYSTGLPEVSTNTAVFQKNTSNRIYVGTDIGVYYRDSTLTSWMSYNTGLPSVIINNLEIVNKTGVLRAGTYGRAVWEAPLVDCQSYKVPLTVMGSLNFCSGDSVLLTAPDGYSDYLWSNGSTAKIISVKQSGSHTVYVKNAKGCPGSSETFIVNVNNRKIPEITSSTSKFVLCTTTDSLELDAGLYTAGKNYDKYMWSTGDTTRKVKIKKPGIYSVYIEHNSCVDSSKKIEVIQGQQPLKPLIQRVNDTLQVTNTYKKYTWKRIGGILTNANTHKITIPANAMGNRYIVTVENDFGCSIISDTFEIRALSVQEQNDAPISCELISNSFVQVNWENIVLTSPLTFTMYDITGAFVLSRNLQSPLEQIDIQMLQKGSYIIDISLPNSTSIHRTMIIKQ